MSNEVVWDEAQVKGLLALHCHLAKMEGYILDKKCMRYNAMWDYIRVCGGFSWPAFWEAIETCVADADWFTPKSATMYTGTPFDIEAYKWVLSDE